MVLALALLPFEHAIRPFALPTLILPPTIAAHSLPASTTDTQEPTLAFFHFLRPRHAAVVACGRGADTDAAAGAGLRLCASLAHCTCMHHDSQLTPLGDGPLPILSTRKDAACKTSSRDGLSFALACFVRAADYLRLRSTQLRQVCRSPSSPTRSSRDTEHTAVHSPQTSRAQPKHAVPTRKLPTRQLAHSRTRLLHSSHAEQPPDGDTRQRRQMRVCAFAHVMPAHGRAEEMRQARNAGTISRAKRFDTPARSWSTGECCRPPQEARPSSPSRTMATTSSIASSGSLSWSSIASIVVK